MAFSPKTWVGRQAEHLGRILLTPTGATNEWDVSRSEGNVTTEGDQLSPEALNDLEQRILNAFKNTTVAGLALNDSPTVAQLVAAGLCSAPESGSWLPTYYAGTTAVSVATTRASYAKIGKMVLITLATATSDAISDSGELTVDGLPISPVIDGTSAAYANTANKPILVRSEGTKLYFYTSGYAPATKVDMPDFSYIRLSIIYEVF